MDLRGEAPESEELSFEGPERTSRWAGWLRAHARLVTALALSLGVLAGGGWFLHERSRQPLPPPDGPWPQTGYLGVYLCGESTDQWEHCRGRGTVTAVERRRIEAALRGVPEVAGFRFVTREQALAAFREGEPPNALEPGRSEALLRLMRAEDMPESYDVVLRPGDWAGIRRRIEPLAGVSNVSIFRDAFWWGKADVVIRLCPRSNLEKRCASRGAATEAEKEAVLDRIHSVPGVEAVYFEDRPHALKVLRHVWWEGIDLGGDLPALNESFYLKLDRPPVMRDLAPFFTDLTGVEGLSRVSNVRS
jgi:hypothetical protein